MIFLIRHLDRNIYHGLYAIFHILVHNSPDFYRLRQIDNEIDQSSMESFLLAMFYQKKEIERKKTRATTRRFGLQAGLRIFANTYYRTFNRKPVFFYTVTDSWIPCFWHRKIALRRRISNRVFESQRTVYRKEQPNVETIADKRNINARESGRPYLIFTDVIDITLRAKTL